MPISSFASRDPSRVHQWVVHHHTAVFGTLAVLNLATFVTQISSSGLIGAVGYVLSIVYCALFLAWYIGGRRHQHGFCETCFGQSLGGPVFAVRYKPWLRWHHSPVRILVSLGVLALLLVASFVQLPAFWQMAVGMVLLASCWVDAHAERRHAWLLPWCPWCKGGGDGDLIETTPPVPTGEKVA